MDICIWTENKLAKNRVLFRRTGPLLAFKCFRCSIKRIRLLQHNSPGCTTSLPKAGERAACITSIRTWSKKLKGTFQKTETCAGIVLSLCWWAAFWCCCACTIWSPPVSFACPPSRLEIFSSSDIEETLRPCPKMHNLTSASFICFHVNRFPQFWHCHWHHQVLWHQMAPDLANIGTCCDIWWQTAGIPRRSTDCLLWHQQFGDMCHMLCVTCCVYQIVSLCLSVSGGDFRGLLSREQLIAATRRVWQKPRSWVGK